MQIKLQLQQEADLLLHPRGPPLVRPLPHVEALSLFRAEENNEELAARKSLALATTYDANIMDVVADPNAVTPIPEPTPQPVPTHLPIPTQKITAPEPISISSPVPTSQKMTSSITTASTKDCADIPSAISGQQPTKSLLPPSSTQMELTPPTVEPRIIPVMVNDDDEEEEEGMPIIDMESDSDG